MVVTNTIYIVENELIYGTGGRWGNFSDKGGSSLELIDPHSDNSLAPNWADSDETAKAPWTTIETTGVLDLGNGSYPPNAIADVPAGGRRMPGGQRGGFHARGGPTGSPTRISTVQLPAGSFRGRSA